MRRLLILMLTAALLSVACATKAEGALPSGATTGRAGEATAGTGLAAPGGTTTKPAAPLGSSTAAGAPADASTAAASPTGTSTAAAAPAFRGSVRKLYPALRSRMRGASWHKGCPVPLRDLRLLTVSRYHWDGDPGHGWLVVHADVAKDVVRAFKHLYAKKFRIRSLRLVDRYGADDNKSMAANNTSAFNCRTVSGTTTWSAHSYGRAIDINPVQNPYVRGSVVQPDRGRRYLDRDDVRKGMIVQPGPVRWAFVQIIDWRWGGNWNSSKDYQHFSSNGR